MTVIDYKNLVADLRGADQANWKRLSLDAADAIEALQAQLPKRGEWKKWADKHGMTQLVRLVCSECGKDIVVSKENIPNYCPNCGAKMIGEQNVE